MFRTIHVKRSQRVIHLQNGQLQKIYPPGEYTVWTLSGSHEFLVTSTTEWKPLLDDDPLPAEVEGARLIQVGPMERVALWVNGTFRQVLGPGRYRVWLEVGQVEEQRFDLRADPVPLGREDQLPAALEGFYVSKNFAGQVLLSRDGQPATVLAPGRYRVWQGARWELSELPRRFQAVAPEAAVAGEGAQTINVRAWERAIVLLDGGFLQALGPGRWLYWEQIGKVEFLIEDLREEPRPIGPQDRAPLAVPDLYSTSNFADPALLSRDGRAQKVLPAGSWRVWKDAPWVIQPLPRQCVEVSGDPWAGQVPGSRLIALGPQERALFFAGGAFQQVLGPGRWLYREAVGAVVVHRFDLRDPPAMVPSDDPLPLAVAGQYATTVSADPLLLVRGGRAERVLPPGSWRVWTAGPWQLQAVPRAPVAITGDPFAQAIAGSRVLEVGPQEVAAAFVSGLFVACLPAGRWLSYEVAGELELQRSDLREEPRLLAEDDQLPLENPAYTRGTSDAMTALVLCRDGKPVRTLGPGSWRAWAASRWSVKEVPLSLQTLDVAAQDLLSHDQIPLRVKPAVAVRAGDPVRLLSQPDWLNQVYLAVQLALREVVSGRDLDRLVEERESLTAELRDRARGHLPEIGMVLEVVSVKDIILPGEVKDLMGKVTLAKKEAEAMAIRRREETSQTRQLANTARLLESNPVLMRLKELEAISEIAGKIDRITLVGNGDMVRSVLLSELKEQQ